MVFLDSSVLVTVPSDDWVTVFYFVLTVPSLLVVLVLSLETCRSQPTSSNDNAKPPIATQFTMMFFFMAVTCAMRWLLNMGCYPTSARLVPGYPTVFLHRQGLVYRAPLPSAPSVQRERPGNKSGLFTHGTENAAPTTPLA